MLLKTWRFATLLLVGLAALIGSVVAETPDRTERPGLERLRALGVGG